MSVKLEMEFKDNKVVTLEADTYEAGVWRLVNDLRDAVAVVEHGPAHLEGCARRADEKWHCDCGMEYVRRVMRALDEVLGAVR